MSVAVDGIIVATFNSEQKGELATFEIPLKNSDKSHEVTFEMSAKDVSQRHFCFNAQAVGLADK